jgi:PAS domain S-box-containing protein
MSKKNHSIERKAKVVLNLLSDIAVMVDEKGRLLVVNDVFEEVTGLSQKEVIGKSFLELGNLPAESKKVLLENLMKKMQGLPVEPYEIYFTDKTGKSVCVEVKGKKVSYTGQPADLVVFHDVTRRKENAKRLKEYAEKMEALVDEKVRAIKESEEKFKNLAEQSPNMVFVNKKGRIVYANKKAEEIMGYTKEEFYSPSFNFLCLVAPESRGQIRSVYERHVKNGNDVGPLEYRLITKDGRMLDAILTSRLITYEGDNAILGTVIDITGRKQLEEELRSSEEMFRAMSASAMDAIILLDETDKIVYWNPAAERIFGYTMEEALGNELGKLVVPTESRGPHLMLLEKLIHQKEKIPEKRVDINALRKDGTEFPIELSATALTLKGRTYVLETMQDISERKKMEAEIKQKLDMLEALTQNLGVGLGIISKDYRVLWVNRFIKNNAGDVEGKLCYSSLNTLDHVCPDCGVRKVFEEGVKRDSHEYSQIGVHGDMYHVELIATPLRDKDGNITAALEFVVDIAEKKRMQTQLTEYSQKLEKLVEQRTEQLQQTQAKLLRSERLAAIGELAGMVGHDIRNPLTAIKNAAYYIKAKQGLGSDAHVKKMLEVIDSAITHADKIINDLLDYSREIQLELVTCSPRSLLKEALAIVQVPQQVKIVDATQKKPVIKADKARMVRVFANLIKNAVDAMPNGGTLQVKSQQTRDNVEFSFADTGVGIPKETLSALFLPLVTTKARGMGFGLAICKRIVEAHQGRITVESVEGKGSTFTVTIPKKPILNHGGEKTWVNMPESLLSTTTKE